MSSPYVIYSVSAESMAPLRAQYGDDVWAHEPIESHGAYHQAETKEAAEALAQSLYEPDGQVVLFSMQFVEAGSGYWIQSGRCVYEGNLFVWE